eukprot:121827_1
MVCSKKTGAAAGQMKYWKFRSLLALVDMGHVGNHQLSAVGMWVVVVIHAAVDAGNDAVMCTALPAVRVVQAPVDEWHELAGVGGGSKENMVVVAAAAVLAHVAVEGGGLPYPAPHGSMSVTSAWDLTGRSP